MFQQLVLVEIEYGLGFQVPAQGRFLSTLGSQDLKSLSADPVESCSEARFPCLDIECKGFRRRAMVYYGYLGMRITSYPWAVLARPVHTKVGTSLSLHQRQL